MNLVSPLKRRRRSKNTRTESGLIRVNFFLLLLVSQHSHINFVLSQNPDSNYTDYRFSNMEPSTYPSDHMTHLLIQF